MTEPQTIVIGAGHAGLAVSHYLAALGIEHVVLERDRVGESWRSQRWESFRLNTPGWMNRLPGAAGAGGRDAFPSAAAFAAALERYAQPLPVHEGVAVTALRYEPTRDRYRAETTAGVVTARTVIVASGAQRVPRVPALARALPVGVEQLHAAAYRRPDDLADGVLVVGGAQSGVQIAEDLADAGRRVLLATSRVGRTPRRYRGRDIDAWLDALGFYDRTRAEVPPRELTAKHPQVSGTRGGHTLSLRRLAAKGVTLLGRLAEVDGHRIRLADDLAANSSHADLASRRLRQRIDTHIAAARLDAPTDVPDPDDRPLAPQMLRHTPLELDLCAAGIRTVIWATGFGPDTGWLQLPVLDRAGRVEHLAGATQLPGLFVTGLPWLRTRKSGIVYGAADDAAHVAALAARRAQQGGNSGRSDRGRLATRFGALRRARRTSGDLAPNARALP